MYRKSCPWPPVCNRCGEAKPIDQFSPRDRHDLTKGLKGDCKECRRNVRANDPKTKEYAAKSYYKDLDKSRRIGREISKRWRLRQYLYSTIKFKVCSVCDSEFITIHGSTKTCSEECNKLNVTKRSRDSYMKLRKENYNEIRSKETDLEKRQVNELSDRYIKRLLVKNTGISCSVIPINLIEVKRKHLMLQRLITKENKHGNRSVG